MRLANGGTSFDGMQASHSVSLWLAMLHGARLGCEYGTKQERDGMLKVALIAGFAHFSTQASCNACSLQSASQPTCRDLDHTLSAFPVLFLYLALRPHILSRPHDQILKVRLTSDAPRCRKCVARMLLAWLCPSLTTKACSIDSTP